MNRPVSVIKKKQQLEFGAWSSLEKEILFAGIYYS